MIIGKSLATQSHQSRSPINAVVDPSGFHDAVVSAATSSIFGEAATCPVLSQITARLNTQFTSANSITAVMSKDGVQVDPIGVGGLSIASMEDAERFAVYAPSAMMSGTFANVNPSAVHLNVAKVRSFHGANKLGESTVFSFNYFRSGVGKGKAVPQAAVNGNVDYSSMDGGSTDLYFADFIPVSIFAAKLDKTTKTVIRLTESSVYSLAGLECLIQRQFMKMTQGGTPLTTGHTLCFSTAPDSSVFIDGTVEIGNYIFESVTSLVAKEFGVSKSAAKTLLTDAGFSPSVILSPHMHFSPLDTGNVTKELGVSTGLTSSDAQKIADLANPLGITLSDGSKILGYMNIGPTVIDPSLIPTVVTIGKLAQAVVSGGKLDVFQDLLVTTPVGGVLKLTDLKPEYIALLNLLNSGGLTNQSQGVVTPTVIITLSDNFLKTNHLTIATNVVTGSTSVETLTIDANTVTIGTVIDLAETVGSTITIIADILGITLDNWNLLLKWQLTVTSIVTPVVYKEVPVEKFPFLGIAVGAAGGALTGKSDDGQRPTNNYYGKEAANESQSA